VEGLDVVPSEPLGVLEDDLLGRGVVHAVREDRALAVDDDVAVLPHDLGEIALHELARLAPDRRHFGLVDREAPDDQKSWHRIIVRRRRTS
jgi:hypothetical protein